MLGGAAALYPQRRIAYARKRVLGRAPLPTWASQGREVTELRRACPELAAVPADTMSAIVTRVDQAYTWMYANIKAGKKGGVPRWAKRASDVGLLFRGQVERGTQLVGQHGHFAFWKLTNTRGLGILKVRQHRPFTDSTEIRQVSITYAADGWYISQS